jgi:hypothetical protein
MSELDDELQKDESLWRRWREDGVTETTLLAVDVFFYATSKETADQIAGALRQWGLTQVEVSSTRTLWLFRGWEITGVEGGTWTLEKLQDRSRRYVRLAEIFSATYDGCGALIDPDKLKPPNPQGGADGEQPSGSQTNSTSSAAAPRRSP